MPKRPKRKKFVGGRSVSNRGGSCGLRWGENSDQRLLGLHLLATVAMQPFLMACWCICYHHNGEVLSFIHKSQAVGGFFQYFDAFWPSPFDPKAMFLIVSFMAFELFLLRAVPGPRFEAKLTATGHLPVYCANGVTCYLITLATLVYLMVHDDYYEYAGAVYDKFGEILSSLQFFAIFFCLLLYMKGIYFTSTKDCCRSGSIVADCYWGTELYPRVCGWDVKQFATGRFGMMYWQMGIVIYAFQQFKDMGWISSSMMVSVVLQSVYIFKFFWLETGYLCSMDMQHNLTGYLFCSWCFVWVPCMHPLHTYFLVKHPVLLSPLTTAVFLTMGLLCIWCNYDCDRCGIVLCCDVMCCAVLS
jgi:7-dehydrocholesterol reductase